MLFTIVSLAGKNGFLFLFGIVIVTVGMFRLFQSIANQF